jgi:hypothetical protein
MKKTPLSLLAGMTALVLTAGALSAQDLLFSHAWDTAADTVGREPVTATTWAPWSTDYRQSNYVAGSVQVAGDPTGAVFGSGPNQYLSVRDATAYGFGATLTTVETQVMTISFDLITRANTSAASRALNIGFYGSTGTIGNPNRTQVTSINTVTSSVTGATGSFGSHGDLSRFDIIYNNSNASISHFVSGTEYFIPSGQSSVWVNGVHLVTHDGGGRGADASAAIGQNLGGVAFLTDNHATSRASYDLDNFMVHNGASVIPEPSTYALIFGGLALAGAYLIRRRRR